MLHMWVISKWSTLGSVLFVDDSFHAHLFARNLRMPEIPQVHPMDPYPKSVMDWKIKSVCSWQIGAGIEVTATPVAYVFLLHSAISEMRQMAS